MKKLVLAFGLLVLVLGVSYIKAIRGQNARSEAFEGGKLAAQKELLAVQTEADSIRRLLARREVEMADSITDQRLAYDLQIDSLYEALADREESIARLKKQIEANAAPTGVEKSTKPPVDPQKAREQEIIKYYKSRYSRLPTDLTSYERKVAINEIREETATKFSISVAQLKALRSRYGLDY